jgi:hypothetical protein
LYNFPSKTFGTLTYTITAGGSKVSLKGEGKGDRGKLLGRFSQGLAGFQSIPQLISSISPLQIHSDQLTDLKKIDDYISIKLDCCYKLEGDVRIEFSCINLMKHKQKLFHYWFNTYFVNEIHCEFPAIFHRFSCVSFSFFPSGF